MTKSKHEPHLIPIDAGSDPPSVPAPTESGHPSSAGSGANAPETGAASNSEMTKLRAEKEELLQTLIQRQADFDNYRKRTERDYHEERRRGVERMMADLIPVLDGMDRALQAHDDPAYEEYATGMKLIRKQFWDALARHGLQRMEARGKMFDPHVHEAVERTESSEHPDGSILDVFQDGYTFHGRVLRPAIVRVAVHPAGGEAMDVRTGKNQGD